MLVGMIVAIDGPAGAGKSSVARAVSARLGFAYLDTGALYRATALRVLRDGCTPQEAAHHLDIHLGGRVLLMGEDVTEAIRSPEVTNLTPNIAKQPTVRAALLDTQRDLLHRGDWVAEGRDIGTVVAPDAEVKIYLTATEKERARRRAAQSGRPVELELEDLRRRDEVDSNRDHSPLEAADDAIELLTDGMSFDEVVDAVVELVPQHLATTPRLFPAAASDVDHERVKASRGRAQRARSGPR
jgi:cytidylate kinase